MKQEAIDTITQNARSVCYGDEITVRSDDILDLIRYIHILKQVIGIVREYPDFDDGGAFADMMDQALAGTEPDLITRLDLLSQGLVP